VSPAPSTRPLAEAFPTVRAWLKQGPEAEAPPPPRTSACELAEHFGLAPFGRNVLLLCAYVALVPEGQAMVGQLQGDPLVNAPTVGLALSRLPDAHWQALTADAPLRGAALVSIESGVPIINARLRLAEPVLFRLLGTSSLHEGAASLLRLLTPPSTLPPNRAALAAAISERFRLPGNPVLHLVGGDPDGKLSAFAWAAAEGGMAAYVLHSQLLPQNASELIDFSIALARDLALSKAQLILSHEDTGDSRIPQLFAETYPAPLVIASTEAMRVGQRLALRLDMPALRSWEQLDVWREVLGDLEPHLTPILPRLAATFKVAPELATTIAAELTLAHDQDTTTLPVRAWEACRRATRPRMDDLAQRVVSEVAWDDLVLPPRQKDVLLSIIAQVRNRTKVYEDWGFGSRLQEKGLGVSALFSGPSGVGKSMAGELIGQVLELDVYRVDLSALVSKWVGETEKNLRRVFDAAEDGGVILQFDEADALFGRRSEVKDSHDRHANIEVSYLLQRLETYSGLCILTTNMRDNIDEAFLRRLRFIVDFRFPNREERRAIWCRIFPPNLPREDLNYDSLARLNLAGGSIRNIALGASFLAADRDGAVTMADLLRAAQLEYEKVGRRMTDDERAGWLP
jgi:hypothetical protein